MEDKITIVDYGYGNIFSIKSALKIIGFDSVTTNNPNKIVKSKIIILPGVGAFQQAMHELNKSGITDAIKLSSQKGCGIIGICLGYQMLFEVSEEFGNHQGLGLIEGRVKKLISSKEYFDKVPNVGWRPVELNENNNFLAKSFNKKMFYFVHSYAPHVKNSSQISTFVKFSDTLLHSSVHSKNIAGFQFHPEKSGSIGLKLLKETILKIKKNNEDFIQY